MLPATHKKRENNDCGHNNGRLEEMPLNWTTDNQSESTSTCSTEVADDDDSSAAPPTRHDLLATPLLDAQHFAHGIDKRKSGIGRLLNRQRTVPDKLHRQRPQQRLQRHRQHRSVRRFMRLLLCALMSVVLLLYVCMSLTAYSNPRQFEHSDWGFNTSRNVADYVNAGRNSTLIEPHSLCQEKTFVVIFVCSGVQNFLERQMIRDTWGNTSHFNYGKFAEMHAHLQGNYLAPLAERVRHYREFLHMSHNDTKIPAVLPVRIVFLVGRPKHDVMHNGRDATVLTQQLLKEAERHDDLIQEDFIDSYNNLTLKSIYALKWMTEHCLLNSAYFVKCDDDTFVNVPNLLHYLLGGTVPIYNDTLDMYDVHSYRVLSWVNRLNATSRILIGHLFCTAQPISDVTNKWYMPYYMYSLGVYPRYLSGGGYLMSTDVVQQLYDASAQVPIVYLEDLYVTGLCAGYAHLTPTHRPLFNYAYTQELCGFKGTIIQHGLKADDDYYNMADVHAFVANYSNRCPPPSLYFNRLRLKFRAHCA